MREVQVADFLTLLCNDVTDCRRHWPADAPGVLAH